MGIQKFSLDDFSCDMKSMKQGGEACVLKGEHPKHGEVAVKTWLHASDINIKEVELLMENTYHQNIIQLLGILVDDNSRCIGYIMPYMPNGSLGDVIHNKSQHYDEQQIKSWILQICYGLSYLHDQKIIHRDMKPSKLGTLFYMAPEIFKGGKYDFSADIYSLSITIWEIIHQRIPYDHITLKFDLSYKISNSERPQLSNNLSKEVSDLLTSCWDGDASKRPIIDDVRESCRRMTFTLFELENSVGECRTSFEHLNVHSNNNNESSSETITALNSNESLVQIPFKQPNENFPIPNSIEKSPEKQAILLLGGYDGINNDSLVMLENNGQNWNRLDIKLPYPMKSHGAQFLNNNLYVFGGDINWELISLTYKLLKNLQWEKMADMNKKRDGISNSSVILNNQIWVCGGQDEKRDSLKSVEMYDPETDQWKYMKDMNEGRDDAAAAVVNGKIFCSGGLNRGNGLNSVECYDPSSDVWTLICNMPQSISGHGAVEINGHFIIIGGCSGAFPNTNSFKDVWALDTMDRNAKWIKKSSMPISRYLFGIAKIDNKVFICGGKFRVFMDSDSVEIFDGEVWRNSRKMPTERSHAPAVVVPMDFARDLVLFTAVSIESSECPVQ